jgi:hypothetical protein
MGRFVLSAPTGTSARRDYATKAAGQCFGENNITRFQAAVSKTCSG